MVSWIAWISCSSKTLNIKTFPELAQILIIIHNLNHGEADMESGFFLMLKYCIQT